LNILQLSKYQLNNKKNNKLTLKGCIVSLGKKATIARSKLVSITLLAILVLSVCLLSIPAKAQTDQTASKLQAANTAVNHAFNAVSDAEKAGANVNGLLSQLNYADNVLATAENSYRAGDLTKAGTQADSVLPMAQQIIASAQSAKQTATVNTQNAFYITIASTVIGSIVFVLVLLLVWRRFKGYYIKNLSEAKPELVSNE
jgi:CHASE3 domain sensor protein